VSVAEQLFEGISGRLLATGRFDFSAEGSARKFEPFAIVAEVFVENGLGAAIAALMG